MTPGNAQLSKREKGKVRAGSAPWVSIYLTLSDDVLLGGISEYGEEYVCLSEDIHWLSSPICQSEASYP